VEGGEEVNGVNGISGMKEKKREGSELAKEEARKARFNC
jgi:hypothetical protein